MLKEVLTEFIFGIWEKMNNSNLVDKNCVLSGFYYIKNERVQLYWINLLSKKQRCDTIRAKGYYENNKEKVREQARDKYRNLSEED